MKIVLFSLLWLILMGITSYSYAEWIEYPDKNSELPEVILQLELRDSNGYLVSYIETDQIIGLNPLELNKFLDNLNDTSEEFFIKDDKKYEIKQWEQRRDRYDRKLAFSGTTLVDIYQNEFLPLLLIRHDSFQSYPDDILRIFWTFIRPVS